MKSPNVRPRAGLAPDSAAGKVRQVRAVAAVRGALLCRSVKRLSVTALARTLHYSPAHLRALYRQASGESLGHAMTRVRLDRAAATLRTRPVRIAFLAASVGYSSLETFSRAFKLRYGSTPLSFSRGASAAGPVGRVVAIGLALAKSVHNSQ